MNEIIKQISVKKAILAGLWFVFLTFPIMVIRVNTTEDIVEWRWMNMLYIGLGTFLASFAWQFMLIRKELGGSAAPGEESKSKFSEMVANPAINRPAIAMMALGALALPFFGDMYQTNIMTNALIWIGLGLGLNIVVGLAGLLDLGYVAFYAVGAYTYGLLNLHWDIGFWTVLPLGGLMGAIMGVILGFPVLRLRGDYLAIVTLGFGEIIRLVLENWGDVTQGPSGISNISRPGLFGIDLTVQQHGIYMYFIAFVLVLITIFVVNRLKNSRLGRAWISLREDEIACQAMGIDKTKTKLLAFSLGATWAGFMGVLFAAKTVYINPASFTFMESAIILSIVVIGGMGSIFGVILGALLMILLPEFLREFSELRMLIFGLSMVLVMVFKPTGLVTARRQKYEYKAVDAEGGE